MTQLSRIFFKLTPILLISWGCSGFALVDGVVQISSHADRHNKHGDPSDVVVWLEPAVKPAVQPVQSVHATMLQKNKMFQPHVLPIRVGTVVDFPNADPVFHSAFSSFDGQMFDLALYPPGTSRSVHFRRPGIVRVFCNIHPSMSAVVIVLDTPYFGRLGPDGHYQIPDVAPGSYEVTLFDERATSAVAPVPIAVSADDRRVDVPAIRVSEAGYLRTPHKNKYGQDYPAPADDTYKGAPK